MTLHQMTGLTAHLGEADLDRLAGHTTLGEPLPVLMRAALRLRLVPVHAGPATLAASLTRADLAAVQRAMALVDPTALPARERLAAGSEDATRLAAVVRAACAAADVTVARILARPA